MSRHLPLATMRIAVCALLAFRSNSASAVPGSDAADAERALAAEVRDLGWIVYAARSGGGDWDLFVSRPDGSRARNLTRTPEWNEAAPQLSRDGKYLLHRRIPPGQSIDGNHYGAQGRLVISRSDGSGARELGGDGELPWASWSPDGKRVATLAIGGISFVEIEGGKVVGKLERKGFFQQLVWSPDGAWLCGVANSFGTGWSVARMDAATGAANAVSRVDCCTPDWFPDGRRIVFSSRPPGQKGNGGQGWTQLWMADAEGTSRSLLYGEDGRHIYGGQVSPDGRYVLFTGNVEEDGDPGRDGAPMGLMRLADAPIIGGESVELRALHPGARGGPVLTLPIGWEPCWTAAEIPEPTESSGSSRATEKEPGVSAATAAVDAEVARLAAEVRGEGRIVFSAANERGDWDIVSARPDGSDRRSVTDSPDRNEAGARVSPDGKRLLYYRMPRAEPIDNNSYGTHELVVADPDGGNAVSFGSEFSWASWSPDSRRVACLKKSGIEIVDLSTRSVVGRAPRKGIVEQLTWSPDGLWFAGTANGLGPYWNIGRLHVESGALNAVSETDRYNCTPDWFPDSRRIVYSRGIVPEAGGRAELWWAAGDGKEHGALYVEEDHHIYGGRISPDGRHAIFTRSVEDLGKVDPSRTRMALIRLADAPITVGEALRTRFPASRQGPVLDLGPGWEPDWTDPGAAMAPAAATDDGTAQTRKDGSP